MSIVEIAGWLGQQGVENTIGMNKGGTVTVGGVKATMVSANHSSSFTEEDGTTVYLGEPAGYVLEFGNGYKIYHAGDTNVFGDMRIIGEIYQPDLALLPIGDHFTMGPREARLSRTIAQRASDSAHPLRHLSIADRHTRRPPGTDCHPRRGNHRVSSRRDVRLTAAQTKSLCYNCRIMCLVPPTPCLRARWRSRLSQRGHPGVKADQCRESD